MPVYPGALPVTHISTTEISLSDPDAAHDLRVPLLIFLDDVRTDDFREEHFGGFGRGNHVYIDNLLARRRSGPHLGTDTDTAPRRWSVRVQRGPFSNMAA